VPLNREPAIKKQGTAGEKRLTDAGKKKDNPVRSAQEAK